MNPLCLSIIVKSRITGGWTKQFLKFLPLNLGVNKFILNFVYKFKVYDFIKILIYNNYLLFSFDFPNV